MCKRTKHVTSNNVTSVCTGLKTKIAPNLNISVDFYKEDSECHLRELKNKGKVQLGNPKSGRGRLRKLFITKFKSQFKPGFTKVVATRPGRLWQWSQGESRLYCPLFYQRRWQIAAFSCLSFAGWHHFCNTRMDRSEWGQYTLQFMHLKKYSKVTNAFWKVVILVSLFFLK